MKTLLFTVASILIVGLCVGGCAAPTAGGQPALNTQAVVFGVNIAVADYQALEAAGVIKDNPTVDAAFQAVQKALTDLQNASPSDPAYQTYVKAVNDAAITLAADLAKAKSASK